jgi:predicted nucleotidyltransferase
MNPLTDDKLLEVQALCRRFGLLRLDLFGSAATGAFDPARSDMDFIVEYDDVAAKDNLPPPEVIAQEIVDDLEAALEQFRLIAGDLGVDSAPSRS